MGGVNPAPSTNQDTPVRGKERGFEKEALTSTVSPSGTFEESSPMVMSTSGVLNLKVSLSTKLKSVSSTLANAEMLSRSCSFRTGRYSVDGMPTGIVTAVCGGGGGRRNGRHAYMRIHILTLDTE